MPKATRKRKIGWGPEDCASWTRGVVTDWIDGRGPGGRRTAFPSPLARIAAGEALLRVAEGCLKGDPILPTLETQLKDEILRARRRRQ
jgi:hypothetical protein